jgi:hypothetical protein
MNNIWDKVYSIDSSKIAIENLISKVKWQNFIINLRNINAVEGLPFPNIILMLFIHICFTIWIFLMMN